MPGVPVIAFGTAFFGAGCGALVGILIPIVSIIEAGNDLCGRSEVVNQRVGTEMGDLCGNLNEQLDLTSVVASISCE